MNRKEIKHLAEYMLYLQNEIKELETRVQMHDTGHIKTAINVLQRRVEEIKRRQSGYFDWKDDLLLGKWSS